MTVSPGTDVAVTELLATLAGLPGLLRACVFEVETGTVCMTVGSDVEPPGSLLARARQAHAAADVHTHADDVIVTSSGAHHLLREVPAAAGDVLRTAVLWVYVELDGERADLALARRRLTHATRREGAPAPPSLTFASPDPVPPPPAATPALAMLPPLDESWGPIGAAARAAKTRRAPAVAAPVTAAPTLPVPAPVAPASPLPRVDTLPPPAAPTLAPPHPEPGRASPPASPASPAPPDPTPDATAVEPERDDPPPAPLPRRVPVMGRPLALVEPPTVPPPPPPGAPSEPDDTTTETAVPAPRGERGEPDEPDGDATTTEVAATTTHPVPTHRPAPPAPSLPAPRRPERPGGWDTDAGTLRRLMITLKRLA